PLPEAPGKIKFVIVAVDYFTKWIEAKPLAKTTGKEVKKFVWDNIVCRKKRSDGYTGSMIQEESGAILQQKSSPHVLQSRQTRLSEKRSQSGGEFGEVGPKMGRTVLSYGNIPEWLVQAAHDGRPGGTPCLARNQLKEMLLMPAGLATPTGWGVVNVYMRRQIAM
ncbi:reverse transcriptase domain-containing protein, partial [Tanacetum coccineum]